MKKLLIVHHEEEKKLRITLLFSWIVFIIIAIQLDLTSKYRIGGCSFSKYKGEIGCFKDNGGIVINPKHRGVPFFLFVWDFLLWAIFLNVVSGVKLGETVWDLEHVFYDLVHLFTLFQLVWVFTPIFLVVFWHFILVGSYLGFYMLYFNFCFPTIC